MEPENQPMEKGDSFWKPSFSGSMLNLGGVISLVFGILPCLQFPPILATLANSAMGFFVVTEWDYRLTGGLTNFENSLLKNRSISTESHMNVTQNQPELTCLKNRTLYFGSLVEIKNRKTVSSSFTSSTTEPRKR